MASLTEITARLLGPWTRRRSPAVPPPEASASPDTCEGFGLALSSGGAKGLAHVGVIQVLEEAGIRIEAVAGSSMGAYVGAMWCAGFDGRALEGLAKEIASPRDVWQLVDPVFPPRRGFLAGDKIERRLRRSLGEQCLEELKRPLYVVATELDSLQRAVFETGPLVSAVRASISIPGILNPYVREGVEYVDGGVCDPLPVDVLRQRGCRRVIAVNVVPTTADLAVQVDVATSEAAGAARSGCALTRVIRGAGRWLNQRCNVFAKGNLIDILRRSAMGSQLRLAEVSGRRADVLIHPVTHQAQWHDYGRSSRYIQLGREAALAALPQIVAICREASLSGSGDATVPRESNEFEKPQEEVAL